MNILIIRLSSLGDVVLATSVVEYLKSSFPQSNIWFATEVEYAGLFWADPRVTKVVALERGKEGKAVSELSGVAWDKIIDLQNNRRSVRIRRRIRAKAPVSVFKKRRVERAVLLLGRVSLYPQGDSVIGRYARAAGYSGHEPRDFPPARLCLDERTCEQAMRFFPRARWCGLRLPCFRSARGRTRNGLWQNSRLSAAILPSRAGTSLSRADRRTRARARACGEA